MQNMKMLRVYADTSVFGGVFDDEFSVPSGMLFKMFRDSVFQLLVSDLIVKEIGAAPVDVQDLFQEMLAKAEVVPITLDCLRLRDAYLSAGILSQKWSGDALHVAVATVAQADMIVSWNFHHIVNFRKMHLYNAVNILQGHRQLAIYSPLEVIGYGEEEI